MPLTRKQARVVAALRQGAEKSLVDLPEELHDNKLVTVKAVDLMTLCDAVEGKPDSVPE